MTASQFLIVLLMLAIVAAVAFWLGRNARPSRNTSDIPSEPWARPDSTRNTTPQSPAATKPASTPSSTTERIPAPSRAPAPKPQATSKPSGTLADGGTGITNWGYQLQGLNVARAASSPYDLLVIDPAKDDTDDVALTPAEVARLKQKPDGSHRLVFAYLSIGEAESYRSYWQNEWKRSKPGWLLGENPEWKENYSVCFWEPEWQQIMCGAPGSRLDRILDAGFDGVYLDKCDVYEDLQHHFKKVVNQRTDVEGDMIKFIAEISAHAKARNPGFLVIMQNAEGLLERPETLRIIDGVAKEELVFGVDAPEKRNSTEDFEYSRQMLDQVKKQGKIVLVVEYLNAAAKVREANDIVTRLGYVLYVSDKSRDLAKLNYTTLDA